VIDLNVSTCESSSLGTPLQGALRGLIPESAADTPHLMGRTAWDVRRFAFQPEDAMSSIVQFSPAEAVSRRIASWRTATCEIIEANRRGRIKARFRAPVHMLVVYEHGVRHDGHIYVDRLAQSAPRYCRRKMVFVPAGCDYYEWQEPRTLLRIGYFYLDPVRLASEIGVSGMSMTPRLFFEDAALWDTALKLIALMESGGSEKRRYGEALCAVLVHELVRLHANDRHAGARMTEGLARWQKAKAIAYIREHLAAQIPLATLAQLVHLSPSHFCRAFKRSFGMPPRRYQIAQRIERAKTLLTAHAASVTDISFTVGYSETSAFSTAFRRVTGLTPSAYRHDSHVVISS
jgi:AraC family transcriptional regulator